MQGLLLKIRRESANVLMLVVAATLLGCAKDQPALVDDSSTKNESSMPWNKQEKWETQGQMGGITDRR
jgi:outer membrane biogenesis lipoprotein LolB